MRTPGTAWVLAALFLVAPAVVFAQASITGTVRDTSGAVLPGVTVEAASPALIEKVRSATTDGNGQYRIVDLRAGEYTVTFTLPGFSTVKREGVALEGTFTATINTDMRVGELTETITVTGESPLIETTNASTGGVLDTQALQSIPTAGRSVFLMANLEPTVQTSGNAHWNRMQDQVGNSAMSMGGGAVRANNYLIDGFPVTDLQNLSLIHI